MLIVRRAASGGTTPSAGSGSELLGELGFDPAGVHAEPVGCGEGRRLDDRAVEGQHGRETLDLDLGEGPARTAECLLAIGAGDDELGEERVELPGHETAGAQPGVDPDAGPGRRSEGGHRAGGRQEAARRVFGVQPELEGVPPRLGVALDRQGAAGRDGELRLHEVDARGFFGDRVLHLQARVDLEKRDGAVLGEQVLDGARAAVAGLPADGLRRGVDQVALGRGEEGGRRLFDEFLVAALQRAVAGADDDDVAPAVGENLRLDVPRLVQKAFDEALAATEGRLGLTHGRVEGLLDRIHLPDHFEAAPAAAERRLDRDGEAVLLGEGAHLCGGFDGSFAAGDKGRPDANCDLSRRDLVAERRESLRGSGPTQIRPASPTACAKSAFSERKP